MVRFEATAPRTPYSHFVRKEQLKPSLTAGFRNLFAVSLMLLTLWSTYFFWMCLYHIFAYLPIPVFI